MRPSCILPLSTWVSLASYGGFLPFFSFLSLINCHQITKEICKSFHDFNAQERITSKVQWILLGEKRGKTVIPAAAATTVQRAAACLSSMWCKTLRHSTALRNCRSCRVWKAPVSDGYLPSSNIAAGYKSRYR